MAYGTDKALALTRPSKNNKIPACVEGDEYLSLVFTIQKQGKTEDSAPSLFCLEKQCDKKSLTTNDVSGLNDNLSFLSQGNGWL